MSGCSYVVSDLISSLVILYSFIIFPLPLEVLGIQLGWDAQDPVIDGGDVSQLLLLCLPVDEGLPQTV